MEFTVLIIKILRLNHVTKTVKLKQLKNSSDDRVRALKQTIDT